MGVGSQHHVPTALPQGKTRYPLTISVSEEISCITKRKPKTQIKLGISKPLFYTYAVNVPNQEFVIKKNKFKPLLMCFFNGSVFC